MPQLLLFPTTPLSSYSSRPTCGFASSPLLHPTTPLSRLLSSVTGFPPLARARVHGPQCRPSLPCSAPSHQTGFLPSREPTRVATLLLLMCTHEPQCPAWDLPLRLRCCCPTAPAKVGPAVARARVAEEPRLAIRFIHSVPSSAPRTAMYRAEVVDALGAAPPSLSAGAPPPLPRSCMAAVLCTASTYATARPRSHRGPRTSSRCPTTVLPPASRHLVGGWFLHRILYFGGEGEAIEM